MTPVDVQALTRVIAVVCIEAPHDLSPHLGRMPELTTLSREQQDGVLDNFNWDRSLGSFFKYAADCGESVGWQSMGAVAEIALRSYLS